MISYEEYLDLRKKPISELFNEDYLSLSVYKRLSRFAYNYDSDARYFSLTYYLYKIPTDEQRYYIDNQCFAVILDALKTGSGVSLLKKIKNIGPSMIYGILESARYLLKAPQISYQDQMEGYQNYQIIIANEIKKIEAQNIKSEEKENSILDNLKEKGLSALNEIDAIQFAENSNTMKQIGEDVEKYLNHLTQEKVNESPNPDYAKIESEIDKLMAEFKKIVDAKRKQIKNDKNPKATFISKMANKIGDVKKYHHTTTNHQEGHSHNPFAEDIRSL